MATEVDEFFMQRAIALASRGIGRVSPNPLVGCVIVSNGEVVAEGWHDEYGEAHAEAMAIASVDAIPRDSILYVTLEPCSHVGKTPACSKTIIDAGVKRVVIGCVDPNPKVSGRGIGMLAENGVEVSVGILEDECSWQNRCFLKHVQTETPYVIGKVAVSADGFMAAEDGTSKWISSEISRLRVHNMRAEFDAVMVGVGTVISDNPHLTVRGINGRNPKRIIVDPFLKCPANSFVATHCSEEETYFICSANADKSKRELLSSRGAVIIEVNMTNGTLDMKQAFNLLGKRKIVSILCEGGGTTMSRLIEQDLLDELHVFTAPMFLGKGLNFTSTFQRKPGDALSYALYASEIVGHDTHTIYLTQSE